jgi:mono/diheme cytochrome c family protein
MTSMMSPRIWGYSGWSGMWLATAAAMAMAMAVAAPAQAAAPQPGAAPAATATNVSVTGAPAPDEQNILAKGKYLLTAGDCVSCHTAPGGQPLAGGLKVDTPFGPLYSPNITPDKATGIGNYTDDQFYRTMHEGIGPGGELLYPVFPFPWYTKLTRDDALAIKAYLFSLQPVSHKVDVDQLSFPFSIRASLAGWREIYFKAETFKPDPAKSPEINRGAYLVEGLGHCAECHTPHNIAGATEQSKAYTGAMIDNWYAPNISSDMQEGIGSWSVADLVGYLKTGVSATKGIVAGPMAEVVHQSLGKLTDADVTDIALYLKQIPGKEAYPPKEPAKVTPAASPDTHAYATFCASCHQRNGQGVPGVIPALNGNGSVQANGPQDVVNVVLGGLPADHDYPAMPAIGAGMSDQDVAAAINYVRASWGNKAPQDAQPGAVGAARARATTMWAGGPCDKPDANIVAAAGADADRALADVTDGNMLPTVNALVGKVKSAGPRADVINSLTAMYCPFVAKTPNATSAQKSEHIARFAQLTYTALVQPGGKD